MSFRNYYDTSSYGRNRDVGRSSTSTPIERPTTVTAKYINSTPSYKSSSIPILCSDRSGKDESPISSIASRYANYNKNDKPSSKYDSYNSSKSEKPLSKYEKKDYSKLSVPLITTNKSRDVSPVPVSKYNVIRAPRNLSPERRTTKNYKDKSSDASPGDKDIPSKTDKSTGYNSLSSYKLYPRTSNYTRPSTRTEAKPEVTVNRYAIASRLSSNYLRSPPTVKRTSVSPVNHVDHTKNDVENFGSSPTVEDQKLQREETQECNAQSNSNLNNTPVEESENEYETVSIITRHTSPTPPGSSAYVRSRRADMAKTIEKTISRVKRKIEMVDKEIQSDRLDDPTRSSRFGSTARTSVTNWSYYTPSSHSYTGYAGRYSTQYLNLRDNSHSANEMSERSSRSHSSEPERFDQKIENTSLERQNYHSENAVPKYASTETNDNTVSVYATEQNNCDDTSEIIINVNLKLKRAKSPVNSTELVSPEITITNSQLPPQAPKTESNVKTKKIKVRKSSTDSASDSGSKKKIIKRRSKSASPNDSDQGSEVSDKGSPPKSINKTSSSNNIQNGHIKLRHSKSRDSDSPESSITLSTQSSISEDETVSKSKTNDVSRTSADELSIPTDHSGKQAQLNSNKGENNAEEAKSFLIRALAPVTNLFKRHQESSDNSRWLETSTSESTGKDVSNLTTESERSSKGKNDTTNIIASNDDNLVKLKAIRPIESGERAWWLESDSDKNNSHISDNQISNSDKNIPHKIRHIESGERAWWQDPSSESKKSNQIISEASDPHRNIKNSKYADDEKPWWLDSSANIPEGIERLSPPRKSSSDSEKFNFFKVRRIESGEQKDWWLTSNENSTNNSSNIQENQSLTKSGSDRSFPLKRIRHIESGERPWWLSSDKNIPEGVEKLPTPPPPEESDTSDCEVQVYVPQSHIPPFPLHLPDDEPLGDRRSPEGLETPRENEDYNRGRTSPYENNRQYRRSSYAKGVNKYISRYTDIDDILGTSGQLYSPFMDNILASRTGQIPFDDGECEEIDPTQVRIHDSTAQRPVIKKIRSRSDLVDFRDEDQGLKQSNTKWMTKASFARSARSL